MKPLLFLLLFVGTAWGQDLGSWCCYVDGETGLHPDGSGYIAQSANTRCINVERNTDCQKYLSAKGLIMKPGEWLEREIQAGTYPNSDLILLNRRMEARKKLKESN